MTADEEVSDKFGAINVQYWCRMAYWAPEEFEWLILGIDPDRVCDEDFDQRPYKERRDSIRARFDRRTRQTNRYPTPREALKIAEDIGEAFPPDLVAAVHSASDRAIPGEAEPSAAECPRAQDVTALKMRISSLHKIILVLAAEAYGWDPTQEPSVQLVKEIDDAFQKRGLSMYHNTIRKHLRDTRDALNPAEEAALVRYFKKD